MEETPDLPHNEKEVVIVVVVVVEDVNGVEDVVVEVEGVGVVEVVDVEINNNNLLYTNNYDKRPKKVNVNIEKYVPRTTCMRIVCAWKNRKSTSGERYFF